MESLDALVKELDRLQQNHDDEIKIHVLLKKSEPLSDANPAGRYLIQTRGIPAEFLKNSQIRSFSGSLTSKDSQEADPMVLVPIYDIYNQLVGLQKIALKKDDHGLIVKKTLDNGCKSVTELKEKPSSEIVSKVKADQSTTAIPHWSYEPEFGRAAVIQKGDDKSKVYIAEGIETAASIIGLKAIKDRYTVLASGGVNKLESTLAYVKANFPPDCQVILLKDHDISADYVLDTGNPNKAFNKAAAQFEAKFNLIVKQPINDRDDWNDVIQKKGSEALEEEYAKAPAYTALAEDFEQADSQPKTYQSVDKDVVTVNDRQMSMAIEEYQKALYEREKRALEVDKLNDLYNYVNITQGAIKSLERDIVRSSKNITVIKDEESGQEDESELAYHLKMLNEYYPNSNHASLAVKKSTNSNTIASLNTNDFKQGITAVGKIQEYLNILAAKKIFEIDTKKFEIILKDIKAKITEYNKSFPKYDLEKDYNILLEVIEQLGKSNNQINVRMISAKQIFTVNNKFYEFVRDIDENILDKNVLIDKIKQAKENFAKQDAAIKVKVSDKTYQLGDLKFEIEQELGHLCGELIEAIQVFKPFLLDQKTIAENVEQEIDSAPGKIYSAVKKDLSALTAKEKFFQDWINNINKNYKTGKGTSVYPYDTDQTIKVDPRDSVQLETVQALAKKILELAKVGNEGNYFLYAMELAANL